MEEIIDFEYVLRPIEDPVGNARIERFEIRSVRNAEFDKEEQYQNFMEYGSEFGEEKAPEPPDWSALARACEGHLAKKVKDLWVAAWYAEVLLIKDGFAGLSQAFDFSRQMIEKYWDVIEPNPAGEDGVADTVKMFSGLNNGSNFIDRLRMAPITASTGEYPALSIATIDEVGDDVKARLIAASDNDFQQTLGESIRGTITNFESLNETFKEKCGDDAPPSAKLRECLNQVLSRILEVFPSLESQQTTDDTDGVEDGGSEETGLVQNSAGNLGVGAGNLGGGQSHIQNREEAFRLLEKVSQFFRENEPSSPVSDALTQAVRWGRMSLKELLDDLVEDSTAKSTIFKRTGIKTEEEDS
ncbi:MAG: type VI secretion system protein TssA, partial [Planctomycetota bacterium]